MYIEQTDSTNSLMQRLLREEEQKYASCLNEDIPLIYTGYQTAGRGQTGNGWEAEQGKNLLLSYLLRNPDIRGTEQFRLNILAATLTHCTLTDLLPDEHKQRLTIKWPNDIYYGDKKIAGILVENSLSGNMVLNSITGIGININQEQWFGNAPNPISLKLITGKQTPIDNVMQVLESYLHTWRQTTDDERKDYYMQHLYRRDGYWPFAEREVSVTPSRIVRPEEGKQTFEAQITEIGNDGTLHLQARGETTPRIYHFKQIQFVV